jgi:uncharacterized repeat protein (TIGR01451 family)
MPRALTLAITLELVISVSALAQPRYRESPEPPLADGSVQQTSGQLPPRPLASVNFPTPIVIVDISAPSFVPNGKDIELRIHVENTTAIAAADVHVTYQLPKGGQLVKADPKESDNNGLLTWNIGTLAGSARKDISLTVKPGPDMTDWNHVAKVRFEHGRQGKTKIARPELAAKVLGPSSVQQYDIVPLRLEVSNTGLVEIHDVMVADNLPVGLVHQYEAPLPGLPSEAKNTDSPQLRTWTIPRLAPNEVRAFDFRVLADKAGIHTQSITASNDHGAKHESESKLTVQAPKLELKVDGPAKRGSHQTAIFKITVRNSGNAPLRNITVSDKIPAGCEVVSASEGGQSFDRDIQWILPIVQPNESRVLELTTKVASPGQVQQEFAASYRNLRVQKQVTTSFEQTAALRMDVQLEKQAIAVGDAIRMTILVENSGSALASNVRPTLILPASLEYVSAEPATHRHEGGRVAFDASTVPASDRQTFTVTAKATRAALPAVVTVELESDQLESGKLRRQDSVAISERRSNE